MRFVVAGGGIAGLAAALGVARAGHSAVVLERDAVETEALPRPTEDAPDADAVVARYHEYVTPEARERYELLARIGVATAS
jgi:2-polyprenyl-6-methoxyphenol hydroxylase-like FAD-dependent oxidoreductase